MGRKNMMFHWLTELFGQVFRRRKLEKGVVSVDEDTISTDNGSELQRQANLAELVQAKAAFGAMLTEDADDRECYERLRNEALEILETIDEPFYASLARHQIIRLCLSAGETDRAAALLAEITDDFILDDIFDEFPDLEPDHGGQAAIPSDVTDEADPRNSSSLF